MENIKYFLMTAFLLFFTTMQLSAFTTTSIQNNTIYQIEDTAPLEENVTNVATYLNHNSEFSKAQFSTSNSTDLITNNLTLLYSLCFALVLFNLIVQIKIIVQMIHLFFQFQRKDEFAGSSF